MKFSGDLAKLVVWDIDLSKDGEQAGVILKYHSTFRRGNIQQGRDCISRLL